MTRDSIPTVILGGSDRQAGAMPTAAGDKHPLTGYKGVEVRFGGRPLVRVVADRCRESGSFGPVYVAGPSAVYRSGEVGLPVIETDGTLDDNVGRSVEWVAAHHPGRPVAILTCDVLPDEATLRRLAEAYRQGLPCELWFPMIRAPRDRTRLGASAWKPRYRVVEGDRPAVEVLPGHLVIATTPRLRLRFLYRLLRLGYRTRNRPIGSRRHAMIRASLGDMLREDLLEAARLRAPDLMWSAFRHAIPTARALGAGRATREQLEESVCRLLVPRRFRRRRPERSVRMPIVEALSLAMDIDTREEAQEVGGEVTGGAA